MTQYQEFLFSRMIAAQLAGRTDEAAAARMALAATYTSKGGADE